MSWHAFHSFHPGPPLSGFVQSFWLKQTGPQPSARARGLPTGTAQLIIDLGGDGLPVPDPEGSPDGSPAGSVSTTGSAPSAPTVTPALFHGADLRYFLHVCGRPVY